MNQYYPYNTTSRDHSCCHIWIHTCNLISDKLMHGLYRTRDCRLRLNYHFRTQRSKNYRQGFADWDMKNCCLCSNLGYRRMRSHLLSRKLDIHLWMTETCSFDSTARSYRRTVQWISKYSQHCSTKIRLYCQNHIVRLHQEDRFCSKQILCYYTPMASGLLQDKDERTRTGLFGLLNRWLVVRMH